MLGWEFPPLLAGGLGMACYGLARAMSKHVDLTLLIPRAEEDHGLAVDIKGLNKVSAEELGPERPANHYLDIKGKLFYVEHPGLDPYPYSHYQEEFYNEVVDKYGQPELSDPADIQRLFQDKVAYGPNIMYKVAVYANTVARMARQLDFDLIHAHDWITYAAAIKIRNESKKPLVIHLHSLETDRVGVHAQHQAWNEVYKIERQGIQAADAIIPVSKFTAQCAEAYYDADPEKLFPVYNSIDPLEEEKQAIAKQAKPDQSPKESQAEQEESEKATDFGKDQKLVVFLGRVTHQKGPEYLLQTAELLLAKDPTITFAIAGRGDMLDFLRGQVYEKGLQDRVLFLGFLNKTQVNDLLSRADAYFMPSVSEPFGLSALEAGQFGVPCVLSKQSGAAEVMDYSLTADYWDVQRFANYIFAAVHYQPLSQMLSENTVKKIHQMSWDTPAQEVLKVYHRLLEL